MPDLHDLELLLRNQTPLIVIETLEEPRVLQLAARLSLQDGEPSFAWTVTEGLRRADLDASCTTSSSPTGRGSICSWISTLFSTIPCTSA
jgi:hypothetical protein